MRDVEKGRGAVWVVSDVARGQKRVMGDKKMKRKVEIMGR